MFKMLAIDIDDTLLNDQKQITKKTKTALAAAAGQGVLVTLATGRMYASAKQLADELQINVPLITYQGSLVKNSQDENVLYERTVPREAAQAIYDYCQEHGLHLQLYCNDQLYVQEDNEKAQNYAKLSKIPYTVYTPFMDLIQQPSAKMLIIDKPDRLEQVARDLNAQLKGQVHITKSKPHFLEIVHPQGTKGDAIHFLAHHFGFHKSEIMAIGDSYNDREMLEAAGLGVAMGNAVPALKEIADYVTLSNNEDGISHAVHKFILSAT